MAVYEEKFKKYVNEKGVQGEHLIFGESCHTVEEAAEAVSSSVSDIVKNICCIADEGRLVTVTLRGEDKVSLPKVKDLLGVQELRMATQEEVLARAGYPCGGVPSFGYEATFLIDEKVLERTFIYTGGGDEYSLFKITPQELVRANEGKVADVRKS